MSINIEDYTHYLGKTYVPSPDQIDSVLASGVPKEKVITDQDLPLNYRIFEPNSYMMLDFIPDRVNFKLDGKKVVKNVHLG